jgi:hypothetical protein
VKASLHGCTHSGHHIIPLHAAFAVLHRLCCCFLAAFLQEDDSPASICEQLPLSQLAFKVSTHACIIIIIISSSSNQDLVSSSAVQSTLALSRQSCPASPAV